MNSIRHIGSILKTRTHTIIILYGYYSRERNEVFIVNVLIWMDMDLFNFYSKMLLMATFIYSFN